MYLAMEKQSNSKVSPQAERMLGHLLRMASPEGEVEVLLPRLARDLGVSLSTVKRARRELLKAGELVEVERGGGRGRPSKYRVTRIALDPKKQHPALTQETRPLPAIPPEVRQEKPSQPKPVHELVQAALASLDPWVLEVLKRWLVRLFFLTLGGGIGGLGGYLITGNRDGAKVGALVGTGAVLVWLLLREAGSCRVYPAEAAPSPAQLRVENRNTKVIR